MLVVHRRFVANEVVLTFNVSIHKEAFVLSVMPTQDKHPSHTRSAGQIKLLAFKLTKGPQFPNTSTYKLENPQTHQLKNLKSLSFILQYHSNFRSVLAKI